MLVIAEVLPNLSRSQRRYEALADLWHSLPDKA